MKTISLPIYLSVLVILGCNQLSSNTLVGKEYLVGRADEVILCAPGSKNDTTLGAESGHLQRTDSNSQMHLIADGFEILPVSRLNGWASFIPNLDSAVVFGDIIIDESELAPVHTSLAAKGLKIKDAHRYGARNGSIMLFLHVSGSGSSTILSSSVNSVFADLEPETNKTNRDSRSNQNPDLNWQQLDSIIGYSGQSFGKIYKHAIERPDVLKLRGIHVSSHVEFNTWASWQGTDENAVVAGDFMILENEVGPVIQALAQHGFELVDNHAVHEGLAIFSLHYLGFGNAEKLAKGLRAALNEMQVK